MQITYCQFIEQHGCFLLEWTNSGRCGSPRCHRPIHLHKKGVPAISRVALTGGMLRGLKRERCLPTFSSGGLKLGLRSGMPVHRTPGFIFGMADVLEPAVDALRCASEAQLTSVPDDLVREQNPFFARD